ncbi:MAG: glutathione synthase [Alphaproteobacteria bacterium]|nr:glutathione synthase [Alphaproteobacteria bacterium]
MVLSVAIQMDPIASIDIDADSTFMLALEAQARGHVLYHYLPQRLALEDGRLTALAHPLGVRREKGNHFTLGQSLRLDLAQMDVVLMRQDPPFDMAYITATHLLERIHPKTLVVNDPASVRNAPEKLFATLWPGLMAPTLISADAKAIADFRARHGEIVLKPLYGNGGAGVFHVTAQDDNFNALLEMFASQSSEPIMAQKYLPEVRAGDKRIILVDGVAKGAVLRVPSQGEARANLHVGGRAVATELTRIEHEICETIGPELKRRGLIFVGIDVIGDRLTEINVTSPTGIQEINRLSHTKIEADIWNAIEARLHK